MMKKTFLIASLLLTMSGAEAKIQLPRIISDGMVLQRNDSISLWGKADVGEEVVVQFLKKSYRTQADAEGRWTLRLAPAKAGGPYALTIGDQTLHDVYVGDVWLTSGQSNMDVHIDRVREVYADEVGAYANPKIRLIQLDRTPVADGPQDDIGRGSYPWESLQPAVVGHWSALSYFFAQEMYEQTGVPQGIINASLGGTHIASFISRGKLEQVAPEYVRDMDRLRTAGYLSRNAKLNRAIGAAYNELLKEDPGLQEEWASPSLVDADWEEIDPLTHRNRWRGTLWLRKTFEVPDSLVGREAVVRLGYWFGADETYLNGERIGSTGYEYPPRLYKVKAGQLKAGTNVLTLRLTTGGSPMLAQKDKPYRVVFPRRPESAFFDVNDTAIPLDGTYRMKEGLMMPNQPGVEVVNNQKGSALYDGQIAPISRYGICGIIWNQGEANAGRPDEYAQLLPALAEDWRSRFGPVPLIIVQLANYMDRHKDANFYGGWARIREVQRRAALSIPNAGLACAIDIGEWNDIHPLRKKDIAHRCALQARRLLLGWQDGKKLPLYGGLSGKSGKTLRPFASEGPAFASCEFVEGKAIVCFRPGTDQLRALTPYAPVHYRQCDVAYREGDPEHLEGFAIAGADGRFVRADARIEGNTVVVSSPDIPEPCAVRYGWDDNPAVSLFGANGLPAPPFSTQ